MNVEIKINTNTFSSWIYRKPTHTNVFLNFKSVAPDSFKRGLILGLLTTAQRLSSSSSYFYQEVCKLRDIFVDNSYPISYFNKTLSEFENNEKPLSKKDSEDFVILKIPFVGSPSFEFSKKMRQTLTNKFKKPIKCVFNTFKVGQCFILKSVTPKPLISNVVYKFTCRHDAEIFYIGKTKRHFITRAEEHTSLKDETEGDSQVKKHLAECEHCSQVNLDSFEIFKKATSSFDVIIYEGLLIKKYKPTLNKQLFKSGSFYTFKAF